MVLSMLYGPGPSLEETDPLFPCLVLRPFFLTKFKYRDNGTHMESDGCFALAPEMASDPYTTVVHSR